MKKGNKKSVKIILYSIISFCVIFLSAFIGLFFYARSNIDYSRDEMLFESKRFVGATRLFYEDTDGEIKEYSILSPSDNKSLWYSYEEIPSSLKSAFISAEDRGFFSHGGVDYKRTAYALLNYILKLRSGFGGSTITQQVIKNISGDNEHSITRKLNEMLRAVHIEDIHTKEEIFEVYLNIVPMGDGINGVGFAAEYYFGKEPSELTVDEAATLVGITNAPSRYNPYTNYKSCLEKRNRVLYAMLDNGVLTEEEYDALCKKSIPLKKSENIDHSVDSWFSETVLSDVSHDLAEKKGISESAARILLLNGGYSVYTTVNPDIQKLLEDYFANEDNLSSSVKDGLEYSMIVLDSKSGRVVGIVGAAGEKSANRLTNYALVPHVPGSTLKPLALYAALIERGEGNWATVFDDAPVSFYQNSDGEYVDYPKNSPQKYDGLISVADALKYSKNTVAARIYEKLGKEYIFNFLTEEFGFSLCDRVKTERGTLTDKALSPLALGQLTYGISIRELAGAYSVFSGDGIYSEPITYTRVTDSSGKEVLNTEQHRERVFSKSTARIMNMMLSGVVNDGTAKKITLGDLYDTAGKTGTSGADKDRLFVGYMPYYTAAIWCGYTSQDKGIGRQKKSHLEIWDEVMHGIHKLTVGTAESLKYFSTEGLEYLPYCKDSGQLFSDNCIYDPRGSRLDYGYFTSDNKPITACKTHRLCIVDSGAIGLLLNLEDGSLVSLLDIKREEYPLNIEIEDGKYIYEINSHHILEEGSFFPNEPERESYKKTGKRKKRLIK